MLYDGLCPICVTEIQFLQFLQRKKPEKVDFVDISLPGYDGRKYKEITYEMAMEEMHVIDKEDKVSMDLPIPSPSILGTFWLQCIYIFKKKKRLTKYKKKSLTCAVCRTLCYCAMSSDWSLLCQVHRGVPAFAVMYSAVGLGWLARLMTWPPVRPFMDKSYAVFARNRLKWTGRGDECKAGRCEIKSEKKWCRSVKTFNYELDKQQQTIVCVCLANSVLCGGVPGLWCLSENIILHDKIFSVFWKI